MKLISSRLALQPAILAFLFAAAGHAEEKGSADFSKQEFQCQVGILQNLPWACRGKVIVDIIPCHDLRGSSPKYLENQLRAFIERRRINPVMFNVAHALSPSMVTALAAHFQGLNPNP